MLNGEKIIDVKDLCIGFNNIDGKIEVVTRMSFHINKGETVGIVGESGCGKSLTALGLMRLLQIPPGYIEGELNFEGKNLLALSNKEMRKIRGNQISMIFQEPMTSLNPVISIGEQIVETYLQHQKISKKEAFEKSKAILQVVGIAEPERRLREYPHQLSGGMRQRIMIAMALACNPNLLIADEPTTALDVTIQAQILEVMKDLKKNFNTAIMLITHDLGVVAEMCSRAIIVYCGRIVEEAPVEKLLTDPQHPYTMGLLNSIAKLGVKEKLYVIPGTVPSPANYPKGCVFNPRCTFACEKCQLEEPPMTEAADSHFVRCWRNVNTGVMEDIK